MGNSARVRKGTVVAISTYYGKNKGKTALELYSTTPDGDKVVHRQLCDQEAYDTWHLADLYKEILYCRKLMKRTDLNLESLPRKEKDLLIYLILYSIREISIVTELGSSLFEMIDGLELVERFVKSEGIQKELDLKSIKYRGIEISELLCESTLDLHPNYDIDLYLSVANCDGALGLLYDRCVSSYAFDNATELAEFINRSDVALMNLFLAKGDSFSSKRLGKQLTYFSATELEKNVDKRIFHLFGTKAPGPASGQDLAGGNEVLEGFFLICDEQSLDKIMSTSFLNKQISYFFEAKQVVPKTLHEAFELASTSN